MRQFGIATFGLVLAILVWAPLSVGSARAGLVSHARQEGTPAASPAPEAPPPAEAPAPTEAPPPTASPTDVVTLVAWYALDPAGDVLSIVPIQIDPAQQQANPAPGGPPTGQADLPADGLPSITLGDSRFVPYNLTEENPSGQRWTWFDGEEGLRPATLVIQIAGVEGTYNDYIGTATFVSRDEGNAGGVLVLALRPPGAEPEPAPTEAPAAEAPADAAPAATPPA